MAQRGIRATWPYALCVLAVASLLLFLAPDPARPNWSAYVEVSWGIWLLAVCSLLFLAPAPAGRIAVPVVAIAVIVLYGLNIAIHLANAPYYGGVDVLLLAVASTIMLCGIVSVGVARLRAP